MSGIAGCFNLDGAPADRALLERMMRRLSHRGPDGSGLWTGGAVGLVHLAFHTTPESVRERQPLADAGGTLHLTMDGRVDNRVELLADLRAKGIEPRDDTDAELVLQAYRCWGEECPVRIIGDFAFAIWDARAEKLFCARDATGVRQFYYYRDARTFLWATEWRALFEHSAVTRAPNESMVAQHLCNIFTSKDDTLFRDVARLQAGHALTLTRDNLRLCRYWDVDLRRIIRAGSDDDHAEQFLDVFREAVRCRLRVTGPVGVDLSGGLDSSSIVGMAHTLRANGEVGSHGIEAFSMIFPGRACDERPFIEEVAKRWNFTPHYCEGAALDRGDYEAQAQADFGLPQMPNGVMINAMRRLQVEHGVRVVLDGSGGDEWLAGGMYRFADLLRQGRVGALARELRFSRNVTSLDHSLTDILRFGFWPLLPLRLRLALRRVLGREGARSYIGPALAHQIPPPEALCRELILGGCQSFDRAEMYMTMLHGAEIMRTIEEIDRRNARFGIEARWPFMDRRFIEFAFALPQEQRWRGDQTKYVLRRAMRDHLPPLVSSRLGKAEFSHSLVETMRKPGMSILLAELASERLGWVRGAEMRRIYSELLARYNARDPRFAGSQWPIWWLFAVEIWLKEVVLRE